MVTGVSNGTTGPQGVDASNRPSNRVELAQPSKANLTAADGFVYDFLLSNEDYIAPDRPLPYDNMTALPAASADALSAVNLASAASMVSWKMETLSYNKQLWNGGSFANRKIQDAIETLQDAASIYASEPLFEVTNKTNLPPVQVLSAHGC